MEREILTLAVETGAMSVLATFQVTGRVEPLATEPPESGEVTRKGPAPVARSSVVSALLVPPFWSRAVKRKCSDNGLALTPAKPT